MPIYEYELNDGAKGCVKCRKGIELMQSVSDAPLDKCPRCGSPLHKRISACTVGRSASNLDDRAKSAGFSKLKRLGRGEYEKVY